MSASVERPKFSGNFERDPAVIEGVSLKYGPF